MHKILTTSAVLSVLGFTTVASADIVSGVAAVAGDGGLIAAMNRAYAACSGISEDMADMKKKAGIATATGALATASGAVALGTGLAKSATDAAYDEAIRQMLNDYGSKNEDSGITYEGDIVVAWTQAAQQETYKSLTEAQKKAVDDKINDLLARSKKLGHIRTGTMAASAVSNVTTAVLAGTNTVKEDLETRVQNCITSVNELSRAKMQASLEGNATPEQIKKAEAIYSACGKWSVVDLTPINNRAKGAAISGGVGAGLGIAGTIASLSANKDAIRDDNSAQGQQKEKTLNTASNVLAGGTAVAGLASTIFSATQIKAIKTAATVADECEGAL